MSCLPAHGKVDCTRCFQGAAVTFDVTKRTEGSWRLTHNPLAWGNPNAEIVVLGFSKGPTQAGALGSATHDDIPYKGGRLNVGKILAHVGLIRGGAPQWLRSEVDRLISERSGRFHFGSLVRCTVEQLHKKSGEWIGSGAGMLEKFLANDFGQEVAGNCSSQFLRVLPPETKLVVMFGYGSKLNYVRAAKGLFERTRGTPFRWINDVSYTDGKITVVHVEHFAAQGATIPNWLGVNDHARAKLGLMARDAVSIAL